MKKIQISLLFVLLISIIACSSIDSAEIQNASDGKVLVIGHAGLGFAEVIPFNAYPSNSYTSLYKALVEEEADGLEVDIHMTADGEFVLYHDRELDSKTNLSGCIEELNYEEVVKAKYTLGFPYDQFQNEHIIGLDSLLGLLKSQDEFPHLHLDVRNRSSCFTGEESEHWEKLMIARLLDYLEIHEVPKEKVIIISVSFQFLEEAIHLKCQYPLSFELVGPYDDAVAWCFEKEIDYLTVKPKELSQERTAAAHAAGLKVITFGGKSKSGNKDLLELNPDVIQTNNVKALKKLLN